MAPDLFANFYIGATELFFTNHNTCCTGLFCRVAPGLQGFDNRQPIFLGFDIVHVGFVIFNRILWLFHTTQFQSTVGIALAYSAGWLLNHTGGIRQTDILTTHGAIGALLVYSAGWLLIGFVQLHLYPHHLTQLILDLIFTGIFTLAFSAVWLLINHRTSIWNPTCSALHLTTRKSLTSTLLHKQALAFSAGWLLAEHFSSINKHLLHIATSDKVFTPLAFSAGWLLIFICTSTLRLWNRSFFSFKHWRRSHSGLG